MRYVLLSLMLSLGTGYAQTALLPSPDHDFGTVKQGARVSHAFIIRNTGQAALAIEKVEPAVSGVTVRFPPTIQPGAQGNIVLEWNTARVSGESEGFATVYTNDGAASRLGLRFRAIVQPPVEFQPFPAVFFTAYRDQSPEKSLRIINHEEQALTVERIEAPKRFEVKLEQVRAGREYELKVRLLPGSEPGRTTEPIYLFTNNPARPRLAVNANAFVKENLYAFPEKIEFGSLVAKDLTTQPQLLNLLTQRTVITNREGPIEVRSVTSNLPFLKIVREPVQGAAKQFMLKVDVDPAKLTPGSFQGAITVATNDPKHPEIKLPVTAAVQ